MSGAAPKTITRRQPRAEIARLNEARAAEEVSDSTVSIKRSRTTA